MKIIDISKRERRLVFSLLVKVQLVKRVSCEMGTVGCSYEVLLKCIELFEFRPVYKISSGHC